MVEAQGGEYDERYYAECCTQRDADGRRVGPPCRRDEPEWLQFFGNMASRIARELGPRSVLDIGCAIGLLVEGLQREGVESFGFDISEWAISQVSPDIKDRCWVGDLTEELDRRYDLITCIEVLEHVPAHVSELAIANMCRHTDTVLLSTTPDDFTEPTHLNVQPADYWAGRFARNGFLRDVRYDPTFISPQAVLFRRSQDPLDKVVETYERTLWQQRAMAEGARTERARVARERDQLVETLETVLAESSATAIEIDALRFELARVTDARAVTDGSLAAITAERDRLLDTARRVNLELDRVVARHEHDLAAREQFAAEQARTIDLLEERNRNQRELVRELESEARTLRSEVEVAVGVQLGQIMAAQTEVSALYGTKTLRYAGPLRRIYGRIRFHRPAASAPALSPEALAEAILASRRAALGQHGLIGATSAWTEVPDDDYRRWIEAYDTLDASSRGQIKGRLAALPAPLPKFSVVMPVYDPEPAFLAAAVESVVGQLYTDWELCIADDASTSRAVRSLLDSIAAKDKRIKLVRRATRGHIAAATNSAVELATGEWVVFLDHDDVLTEDALACVAVALAGRPTAQMFYSDEDKLDQSGQRQKPYFKPDFDPVLLLGQNYVAHLRGVRRDLLAAVGGIRSGFDGSQDWELSLRLAEQVAPNDVLHIPKPLYHWRVHARSAAATIEAKPYARSAAARAIGEHLERTGRAGDVLPVFGGSYWRVRWRLPAEPPSVTIVVCTRDGVHLSRCLESIWSRTSYPNYQLLVVDNGSIEERTAALLATARAHGAAVKEDTRPFNFSALNNAAVRDAASEFICFLNDDVEVITGDWLEEMVGQALQPGVGAVGAKLYFPDGTIQHAGVILGAGGVAGHSHLCTDRLSLGYFARAALVQQMSAVTAAAMVVRREVFRSLGGFDEENLGVAFNDVDFCLRLGVADMKVVWTPFAELYHRESATRGLSDVAGDRFQREVFYMQGRWGARLREDPFYNVNLGLDIPSFSLAWPPRTPSSADDGRAR